LVHILLLFDGRYTKGQMTMEKPWLSVIVPSYNGERWIGTALQSLVDQKEPQLEVLVIDGGSDDESFRIAEGFSDKLDLRAHRRPALRPWTAAANFGVEQARGDHICILHVDDAWLPNRCAELRQWLAAKPSSVMHLHPVYLIDGSGRRLGLWRCPLPGGQSPVPTPILFERLLVQCFISIPAPTIRREAYLRAGGLDDRLWYTADWDLYLKIAAIGEVCYHPTALSCYRIHRNSLTVLGSRNSENFREQQEVVVDRHIDKLPPACRKEVLRAATASIDVNTALAAAINGEFVHLIRALLAVLALGPRGMRRYLFYSRIAERAFPRLRVFGRDILSDAARSAGHYMSRHRGRAAADAVALRVSHNIRSVTDRGH
jgi:glycosyltransferase involved in cell wall biosynthesis